MRHGMKKAQYGMSEMKNLLIAIGVIIVLALLIYLFIKQGQTLLGKNATRTILRH
jgi:hypothetical protein